MRSKPLSIRPRAGAEPVEDLVGWVREGRIRIPDFQRPLRWRAQHVLELFDSLWLGYPVGNLLFWQRPAEQGSLALGPLRIQAEARADALWVVDGQQRLTSLACALLHPHPTTSSGDLFALWFDLVDQRFTRARPGQDLPAHWLPLNRVLDAVQLGEWWSENQEMAGQTDLYRVALQLGRRIRESRLPIYTVETTDPDALKIIFARLNTAGVSMRETEVFNALHTTDGEVGPLEVLARVCVEASMGSLEETWRLRCLRTVADEGIDTRPSRELEFYRDSVPHAATALGAALDFVRTDGNVPHLRLLPYRLPIVALTRFFHLHPNPSDRNLALLRRWLWRGIVNAHHKDTGNPQLRWLTRAIDADESRSVERMLQNVGQVTAAQITEFAARTAATDKTFNAAETKIYGAMLANARPRHLKDGEVLNIGQLLDDLGPNALQRVSTGRDDRILHPYLDDPEALLRAASPEVQASHHWDSAWPNAMSRQHALAAIFQDLLMVWCAPGLPDLPPLDDLFEGLDEE